MAHVCFIIPPSPFLMDERVFMSLGILKVAAVVRQWGQRVEVLDLSGVANPSDVINDYFQTETPDIVGITVTTPQLPAVVQIIGTIRQQTKKVRVVLGGPHITLIHAAFRSEQKEGLSGRATTALGQLQELADVLVAGDGEKSAKIAFGDNPSPSIVDADDPKTDLWLTSQDLDQLPLPARDLIDVGSYHYKIAGVKAMTIVSQLGCPFGCGFCGGRNSPSLRRARCRSASKVLDEMEHLYLTYGARGFMIFDDELNIRHHSFVELLRGIIDLQKKLGVEFCLRGFVKSQLFNAEQAELMYKAGFRWVLTGFESASPRMLDSMNKRATVEENERCVKIAKDYGLKIKALMSLGHPGESRETALDTKDWLLKMAPDDFDITIITVYPGTPYYDESVRYPSLPDIWVYTAKNGDKLYSRDVDFRRVADFYKGNPDDGYESFVFTDHLGSGEIVALRDQIEREVRAKLNIPYPTSATALRYEHSMGQAGHLPSHLLRSSH